MEPRQQEVGAYFKCTNKYKRLFLASTCLLPISVGQGYHEGEKFKATIAVVNKHFRDCHIVVCDSLQRFSIEFLEELSAPEAKIVSLARGNEWVHRNNTAISLLTIPYKISRWDDWKNHAEFQGWEQCIKNLYAVNEQYRSSINETIELFAKARQGVLIDSVLTQKYLMEECAIMSLWATLDFAFEVYPKKRRPATDFVYEWVRKQENVTSMIRVSLGFLNCSNKP